MKNVQVIDDALNCLYEIYAASDEDFGLIFPDSTDIEFVNDFITRIGEPVAAQVLDRLWAKPIEKKLANGIHGTLFYGDENMRRKPFFPTKREKEMVALPD